MDRERQVSLLQRIFALLDQRSTDLADAPFVNPVTTYTDPKRLQREREILFHKAPLFVGLSRDLAAPGSYLTHRADDVPILVIRAQSGELKAMLNVCRHRGAPVLSGTGTCAGHLVCPYHGWTYDDHGRLRAQPMREGFDGIDPTSLGLRSLPVAERYGMIFVRPTAGSDIDIDAHLGGAQDELRVYGLENYTRFATAVTTQPLNWKLVIDTFLESYHVPSLHRETLSPGILGAPSAWDAFGYGGRMVVVRRAVTELRNKPVSEWDLLRNAVVLYNLFPNTMLIHQIDHVEIVQAYPGTDGADSARITFSLYTPTPVTDERGRRHFQSNFDILLGAVEKEDFLLGAQIQRGFHAPGNDSVIYGRNEPGLAHYHRMIEAALSHG